MLYFKEGQTGREIVASISKRLGFQTIWSASLLLVAASGAFGSSSSLGEPGEVEQDGYKMFEVVFLEGGVR